MSMYQKTRELLDLQQFAFYMSSVLAKIQQEQENKPNMREKNYTLNM